MLDETVSVKAYPVSHGSSLISHGTAKFQAIDTLPSNACAFRTGHLSTTVSTAFLFTHTRMDRDVLFMGDVEPDAVGANSLNRQLWKTIAPRAAQGKLHAVFLECSFGSEQPNEFLFGHLTPPHLYAELRALAECIREERSANDIKGILSGLKCIVIHVKDMMLPGCGKPCLTPANAGSNTLLDPGPVAFPVDLRAEVANELHALEAEGQLGVELIVAQQGQRIGRCTTHSHPQNAEWNHVYTVSNRRS